MTLLRFGSAVLDSIPFAGPGHQPLRRRASAPELADLSAINNNTAPIYQAGNTIRLQLEGHEVQAKIVKTFTPFTMAQAMVVEIFEPAIDLEGSYVLKLYDRFYSTDIRGKDGTKDEWTTRSDLEFERRRWDRNFVKFFFHIMGKEHLHDIGEDYEGFDDDGTTDQESEEYLKAEASAYYELLFEVDCLKMYRAELEVYRRAREHHIDGSDIPRFISSVRVPRGYISKHCQATSSNIKGVPGILMQYVPGFSMIDLSDKPSPPPPQEHWKSIIDDALQIVRYYVQHMDMHNMDSCIARNTVVHWDPIARRWKCKLIDFGHCIFKKKDTRKWSWRLRQSSVDAEDAVAGDMELFLRDKKGFQYTWERSQYSWELLRDFRTGDGPYDEPVGYES